METKNKEAKTYDQVLEEGFSIINLGDEFDNFLEEYLSNSSQLKNPNIMEIALGIPSIEPDKFSIDNDIKIKRAGFNLTQSDENREKIKKIYEIIINEKSKKETKMEDFFKKGFTEVELNKILDDIKIDINSFINSKKKYKNAKNNIEIAYECLSSIIFDLNSIINEASKNSKFNIINGINEKIKTWNRNIDNIENMNWGNQDSSLILKGELAKIKMDISDTKNSLSIEKLKSAFWNLSKSIYNYMKQAVQVLSEITQDNQKFYYTAASGLKKLKEKMKLCEEYMDDITNKYLINNINLEYKYLITKEKNKKQEEGKVYTKFFEKLKMKDIFKTSGATYKFPIECDDGYTFSKKKDNDLSLEFKEEKIGLKEIFGVEKFSHWEPDINDIKQDSTGDCYLLAALQSLCKNKNGKKAIRSCFVNGETIESNNFVEIRLYKLKLTEQKNNSNYLCAKPYQEIIVKMSKKRLSESSYYNQGKIWVTFFERAFAYYRNNLANVVLDSDLNSSKTSNSKIITKANQIIDGWYNKFSYKLALENVEVGYDFIALSTITGKENFVFVGDISKSSKELDDILLNNDNITISFNAAQIDKLKIKKSGLYSSHAYSIIEIGEPLLPGSQLSKLTDDMIITLKNPHNIDYYLDFSKFTNFDAIANLDENEYKNKYKKDSKEKRGEIQMQYRVLKEILSEVSFGNS